MSSMLTAVGFVGLGAMGLPMARRLIAAGHRVHVTNVVESSVAAAVANGAIAEAHARAVADAAPVVLVSLPTPAVVSAVALGDNGLLGGAALRTYVDLSTTGRTTARQVAATLAAAGVQAVDAPVSGGVPGAVNGTLTIMVAGAPEAVAAARPFLDSLASKVVLVGPETGQAQVVKVANNMLSALNTLATAEALAIGVRAGVNPATMLQVINASTGRSQASEDKFPNYVLTRRFDYGFRLSLMAKDVGLCADEARALGVPAWYTNATDALLTTAVGRGLGEQDITAAVQLIESWIGQTITDPPNPSR